MSQEPVERARPAMRNPETLDFPTGPAEGETLPPSSGRDQYGNTVSFGGPTPGQGEYVVFIRATAW